MSETTAAGSVVLAHEGGLHARPSVKLTKLAKAFRSRIELALDEAGPWVDAKSIVRVMATKAPKESMLFIRAVGDDAVDAVGALVALVACDFEESTGRVTGEVADADSG